MESNVVKKAKEFVLVTESVNKATSVAFMDRINELLQAGYDVFSSQSIGLDTSGGVSGTGNVMMVVTLVRYEYIRLMESPA